MLLSFRRRRKPAAETGVQNTQDVSVETQMPLTDAVPASIQATADPAGESMAAVEAPGAGPGSPSTNDDQPKPVLASDTQQAATGRGPRGYVGRSKADLAPFKSDSTAKAGGTSAAPKPRADAAPAGKPADAAKGKKADDDQHKDGKDDHPDDEHHDDHHDDKGHHHAASGARLDAAGDAAKDKGKKADDKHKDGKDDHHDDDNHDDDHHDDDKGHHHSAKAKRVSVESDAAKDKGKKADGKPKDGKDDGHGDDHHDDEHHDDDHHDDHHGDKGHHHAGRRRHDIAADELLQALKLLAEDPREPVHVTGRAGSFRIVADPAWTHAHDAQVLPEPYRAAAKALRGAGRRREADSMMQGLAWRQLVAEWPDLLTPGGFFLVALVTAALGAMALSAGFYAAGVVALALHAMGRLFPVRTEDGETRLRFLSGNLLGLGLLTWPVRVAVFALSGGGYKPLRALYALGAVYLAGVLVFSLAHERGLMLAPAKAGGTIADGVVVKTSRDAQGHLPVVPFDPWLYSADILLPMIDLNQQASWQPMEAAALGGCKEVAGLNNAWPSTAVAHVAMGTATGCVRHELRTVGGHQLFDLIGRLPSVDSGSLRLWVEDGLDAGWAGIWMVMQAIAGLALTVLAVLGIAGLLAPRSE